MQWKLLLQVVLCGICYAKDVSETDATCSVSGQVIPCDTPVCPETQIAITCTTVSLGNNYWMLPASSCPGNNDSIRLAQGESQFCLDANDTCGSYSAHNSIPDPFLMQCLTSTLNFIADNCSSISLQCGASSMDSTIVKITSHINITITDPPGPPAVPSFSTLKESYLAVTWTPPTTGGVPTSYNVSINGRTPISLSANTSTFSFSGLTSNTLYSISLVAINCAGISNTATATNCTLAVPPVIQNIDFEFGPTTNSSVIVYWIDVDDVDSYSVCIHYGHDEQSVFTSTSCSTPLCSDIFNVQLITGTYNIYMSSVNKVGIPGAPSNYTADFSPATTDTTPTTKGSPSQPSSSAVLLGVTIPLVVLSLVAVAICIAIYCCRMNNTDLGHQESTPLLSPDYRQQLAEIDTAT